MMNSPPLTPDFAGSPIWKRTESYFQWLILGYSVGVHLKSELTRVIVHSTTVHETEDVSDVERIHYQFMSQRTGPSAR